MMKKSMPNDLSKRLRSAHRKPPTWLAILAIFIPCLIAQSLPAVLANDTVGPVVGTVDATTAYLLYRPDASSKRLRMSVYSPNGEIVAADDSVSTAERDYVAHFMVDGLRPQTTYRYQIEELGEQPKTWIAVNEAHTFTTANPARDGHAVRVAFVSCVDIEPSAIWSEMRQQNVNAVCLMGDTPYIDSSDLEIVRRKHRQFLQLEGLAALALQTPVVGTWDDHDFGLNNGNGLNMQAGKANTLRGFTEYRAHAQYGDGQAGVYHKLDLGMIEIIFLDPRYFSQTEPSPVDATQPTCFGADQWAWLQQALRESKASFKVLAMGAIWQDKKNSETDDMFTYWYERDALLDFIRDEKIAGVSLLGGDIHVARYLLHPQRLNYDLHDFIVSPGHDHTIPTLDAYHPSREWSLVEGNQFLILTADGTDDGPRLVAQFRQPNGVLNREIVLPLHSLTPAELPGLDCRLRARWDFDTGFQNDSVLGNRIDAVPHRGAAIDAGAGIAGGALRLDSDAQSFAFVPRSFLNDNSAGHSLSLWFKPKRLPVHGSSERHFLLESTAEGTPSDRQAWHLSVGLRATDQPDKVNLQLHTSTLQPAAEPQAAPRAISQGPFDCSLDRALLADRWNHVVVTFDSETLRLFLNGQPVAQHPLPIPGPASEFGGLVIGGHRAGVGRNFDGWIDELAIWQRVLSDTEADQLFRQPTEPQSNP